MSVQPPSASASVPPPPRRISRRRKKSYFWPRAIAGVLVVGALVGVGSGISAAWNWLASQAPSEGKQVTVLLIGVDPRPLPAQPGDEETRRLADSLHLVSLDSNGARGYVLSLPRQTGALIGSIGFGQLGDALAVGGVPMLKETIAQVTGIPVSHHVWVEPDGAKKVLELAGETEVYWPVAQETADKESNLTLRTSEGWQKLSAEQALALAWTHTDAGELNRIERQQMLLHRWHQAAHRSWMPFSFGTGARQSQASIQTDLPSHEYEALAKAWKTIKPQRLVFATLPGEAGRNGNWIVSTSRLEKLSEQLMVSPSAQLERDAMPTVEILYDDKGDIKVMELADQLTRHGFRVIRTSRARVVQWETRLIDRNRAEKRSQEAVDALVGAVGEARVVLNADQPSTYGADYTVELGKDFFR